MKQKVLSSNNALTIRIAIAEDHLLVRDMVVANINSLKDCLVVFAAADGQELLSFLETADEPPDICILDINMPRLNGYDTQSFISKHWPDIKTLAVSIYDEPECIAQMLKNGAGGFISKHAPLNALHDAIFSVYEHGIYPALKSPRDAAKGLPTLSLREKECLALICDGLDAEVIAKTMCISVRTVERYKEKLHSKLNVSSTAGLILFVKRTGIVFMK